MNRIRKEDRKKKAKNELESLIRGSRFNSYNEEFTELREKSALIFEFGFESGWKARELAIQGERKK